MKAVTDAVVRKATLQDLDAIGDLWVEFMDFHKRRDPHFARAADGRRRFQDFISTHIVAHTSRVLVAEVRGRVVGYCLAVLSQYPPVFRNRDYGSVFDLAVTARFRRRGIGTRLFRAAEAWFADRSVRRIELRIAVTNEVSTAFWRKMGFQPFVTTLFETLTPRGRGMIQPETP